MSRVDLGNDRWAELRSPSDVSERLRRPISRALHSVRPEIRERQQEAANLPEVDGKPGPEKQEALRRLQFDMLVEEADAYQDATDLGVLALVKEWSFAEPITLDGLLDLPGLALDQLRIAIAPLVNDLFPDYGPSPEKNSPFGSSNGSATPSASAPTTSSLPSGAPTASSSSAYPWENRE